jgi:hypothetical protein
MNTSPKSIHSPVQPLAPSGAPLAAPVLPPVTKKRQPSPVSYQAECDFSYGECLACASPQRDIIVLQVPRQLKRRKLYLWLYVTTALTDYAIVGEIAFYFTQTKIGSLPISATLSKTGGGSIVPATTPCICSGAGGTSTQNTVTIYPSNPVNAGQQSVNLQPVSIQATCDEIHLSLTSFTAGTLSVRAWLGCLSNGKSQQQNVT